MAVIMRILLHQTQSSTSLLTHLGATSINLVSTTTGGDSLGLVMYFGLGSMRFGPGGMSYVPSLGDGPIKQLIPAQQWWEQIVYVLNPETRLSRRKIVLAAANQDGGAHVDSKLSREYQELSSAGGLGHFVTTRDGVEHSEPISNAHFVAIRQMAYELLHSLELAALAGP